MLIVLNQQKIMKIILEIIFYLQRYWCYICDKLQLTLQIQNKEKIVVGGNLNGNLGNDSEV